MLLGSCWLSSDPYSATEPQPCTAGAKPCDIGCVSINAPEQGCAGASCAACPSADHVKAICVSGACAFGPCDPDWGDCDYQAGNGCETDLARAVDHCGSCSNSCLGPNTLQAETSCTLGECQPRCVEGFDDCNLESADGCEAELALDLAHCGSCGHPCAADEICQQGSCVKSDPTLAWLATQQGGWCLDDRTKLINLCGKVSFCPYTLCGDLDDEAPESGDPATSSNCYPDLGHAHDRAVPFCCDPRYFRTYPDGIAIDLGFHYDGISVGRLLSLGGDTPGNSIALVLTEPGTLSAAMLFSEVVTVPLSAGPHIVSVRHTPSQLALHVDGVLVATGTGSPDPMQLQAVYGPGFVLGSRLSYWWQESTTLRFAPFLVHLRDAVVDPTAFSLFEAIEPGPSTVVLFNDQGMVGNEWNAASGAGVGYAISKDLGGADGSWVADVATSCL
jgi:hypothetical protein